MARAAPHFPFHLVSNLELFRYLHFQVRWGLKEGACEALS